MEFLKKNLDSNFYYQAKINNLFKDKLIEIVDFLINQNKNRYNFLNYGISINYTFKNQYGEQYLIIRGKYFDWLKSGFAVLSTIALIYFEIDFFLIIIYFALFLLLNISSNTMGSELLMKYLILEIEKRSKENYIDNFNNITGNENNHLIKFDLS